MFYWQNKNTIKLIVKLNKTNKTKWKDFTAITNDHSASAWVGRSIKLLSLVSKGMMYQIPFSSIRFCYTSFPPAGWGSSARNLLMGRELETAA